MEGRIAAIVEVQNSTLDTARTAENIIISKEIFAPRTTIEVEANYGKVIITVDCDTPEGKTILVDINDVYSPALNPNDITVLFDGKKIGSTNDYDDIMDPNDDNSPEYLLMLGTAGTQVLVSIPHFSTHDITITYKTGETSSYYAWIIVVIVIITFLYLFYFPRDQVQAILIVSKK